MDTEVRSHSPAAPGRAPFFPADAEMSHVTQGGEARVDHDWCHQLCNPVPLCPLTHPDRTRLVTDTQRKARLEGKGRLRSWEMFPPQVRVRASPKLLWPLLTDGRSRGGKGGRERPKETTPPPPASQSSWFHPRVPHLQTSAE